MINLIQSPDILILLWYLILFQCDLCDTKFTRKKHLDEHTRVIHKVGPVLEFKCRVCDKVYNRKAVLGRHIKDVHIRVSFKLSNTIKIVDICVSVSYIIVEINSNPLPHRYEENAKIIQTSMFLILSHNKKIKPT